MSRRGSRRRSNYQPDDVTPEEIEALFKAQEEEERKKKRPDPLEYADYVDDSTNNFDIERRFEQVENFVKTGENPAVAARKVYLNFSMPSEIHDIEGWLDVQGGILWEDNASDNDVDFDENMFEDDDEGGFDSRGKSKNRGKRIKISTFSDIFHVERFGMMIERWPIRKLARTTPIPAEGLQQVVSEAKMKNFIKISSEPFKQNEDPKAYVKFPKITSAAVKKHLHGIHIDGFVLDPPLGYNDYDQDELAEFLRSLISHGDNPYIILWADPDTLVDVVDAANKASLKHCDSVAIELFDSLMEPITLRSRHGFPQHSRMLLMFRAYDAERSSLAQQRIKDTGWGLVYPNGKSHGRLGMPQIPHDILEIMLPAKKRQRHFVEIWPSRFSLRPNWISIDED